MNRRVVSWSVVSALLIGSGFLLQQELNIFIQDLTKLFIDQRLLVIYGRSLTISLATTIIAMVAGLILSYFLLETSLPMGGFFRGVYFWPIILPAYFFATAWLAWLGDLGILKEGPFRITGEGGCIFLLTLNLIPLVIMAVVNQTNNTDRAEKEAALQLGGPGQYFWRFWLPRVMPGVLGAGFLVLIMALHNYSLPSILGVNTLSTEIYSEFGAFYSFYQAFLKSFPFLIILLVLMLLFGRRLLLIFWNFQLHPGQRLPDERRFWCSMGFILWLSYVALTLVIPLLGLIWQTKTLANLWEAVILTKEQIIFSLWFNPLAAGLIFCAALILAYNYHRRKIKTILLLITSLLVIPPVLLGISTITIFNQPWLNSIINGGGLLYLGYLARFLPLMFLLIIPAVQGIPPELEEASWLTGQGKWRTWQRILLPLVAPSLLVSWLISFFLCHGEAETAILLYPPGYETIAVRILSLLHYGTNQVVSGLVLLQIIILGLISSLVAVIYRYYSKRRL